MPQTPVYDDEKFIELLSGCALVYSGSGSVPRGKQSPESMPSAFRKSTRLKGCNMLQTACKVPLPIGDGSVAPEPPTRRAAKTLIVTTYISIKVSRRQVKTSKQGPNITTTAGIFLCRDLGHTKVSCRRYPSMNLLCMTSQELSM